MYEHKTKRADGNICQIWDDDILMINSDIVLERGPRCSGTGKSLPRFLSLEGHNCRGYCLQQPKSFLFSASRCVAPILRSVLLLDFVRLAPTRCRNASIPMKRKQRTHQADRTGNIVTWSSLPRSGPEFSPRLRRQTTIITKQILSASGAEPSFILPLRLLGRLSTLLSPSDRSLWADW